MADEWRFAKELQKMADRVKGLPQDKLIFTYNGESYPRATCSLETFEAMNSFELREDDIMMAAYPKCGSNWTLHLLNDMVKVAYNKDPMAMLSILEFGAPDKFEKLMQEPSPRIFSTHLKYNDIPKGCFEKKVKVLVVLRNPKDTAVSYFHFYKNNPLLPPYSSWDTFLEEFISGKICYGSYFDYVLAWNKHIDNEGVFIITYEELKKDLKTAVKKISEFFEMSLNEEQLSHIADRGTFNSMKEKSPQTHGPLGQLIFRKGDVGDWKNYFSQAQSQKVDAKFEECLAGTKLGEKMNYYEYCK